MELVQIITSEEVQCPYCHKETLIVPAVDYEPIFVQCTLCGKRFVVERTRDSFQTFKAEGCPCCSDPDRRVIETGLGDED
jgi:hypothetical protein